jgi:archaellum biogenesis ATPase FlaH
MPRKTAEKLAAPAVPGHRHEEALAIAYSLIGEGWAPGDVFLELRAKYPDDVTDHELRSLINGAVRKGPVPTIGNGARNGGAWHPIAMRDKPKVEVSPADKVKWWVSGAEVSAEQFSAGSPAGVAGLGAVDATVLLFESLYAAGDRVNLVTLFTQTESKTSPLGGGKTMTRQSWVDYFRKNGIPQSDAGAWMRPNPCAMAGSGKDGAITDSDIVRLEFLLLESDSLPLPFQLALYARLKLPIAAVLLSGGKSAHAWVRLGAPNKEAYDESAAKIFAALAPFGIDAGNKNPSRLSRLPGAVRKIGAVNGGEQRLLWLNPKASALTADGLAMFEQSLKVPAIQEKPLHSLMADSMDRYNDLVANRGKLGLATGIAGFDMDTGGLKPGNFIVIAGETGGGKSSLALNWINTALLAQVGVAYFSLEMDREEICDFLVSLNCGVDRNLFNTGRFGDDDIRKISECLAWLKDLPLWIFDSAIISVEEIRSAVTLLNAENKIGLVVVDYVQLVAASDAREVREQQVAGIATGLRAVAKDSKLPLVALSQLNEDGKLRESRVIAHAANVMIMIDSLEAKGDHCPKMKVVKGRRIKKKSYDLVFDAVRCRLSSAAP